MTKKFLHNAILILTLSAGIFFVVNVAVTSTNYGKLQGYIHKVIYRNTP